MKGNSKLGFSHKQGDGDAFSNLGFQKDQGNMDEEEKKKRLQLKLDLELIEFEEMGGFARVLREIFNPTDLNSMELDSVYQLK